MVRFTICIIIFSILSSLIIADDPCVFPTNNGTIDLRSLAKKDGSPAYKDVTNGPSGNWLYSFNPCNPFTEGTVCVNVAVCQVGKPPSTDTFILAKQDGAKFVPAPGPGTNTFLTYSYTDSSGEKDVRIELICTPDAPDNNLEFLTESPIGTYQFKLSSKCSCPGGCQDGGGSGSGISGGLIFIVILIGFAFLYLIAFIIYNRVHHQRTGLDLIPHRTFWVAVPGSAKDGVKYLYLRARGKPGLGYQST